MSEVNEEDVVLVIIRNPGEPPYPWFLPKDGGNIEPLQKLVGGGFEIVPGDAIGLPAQVDLWCGEEAKNQQLPANVTLSFWGSNTVDDVIAGTAVFKAADDEGRPRNLEDLEVVRVTEWLKDRML